MIKLELDYKNYMYELTFYDTFGTKVIQKFRSFQEVSKEIKLLLELKNSQKNKIILPA